MRFYIKKNYYRILIRYLREKEKNIDYMKVFVSDFKPNVNRTNSNRLNEFLRLRNLWLNKSYFWQ